MTMNEALAAQKNCKILFKTHTKVVSNSSGFGYNAFAKADIATYINATSGSL
jgi:hypothetical protein